MKAVIFDMDGLMIDSERVTFESYQEVMAPMGYTMDKTFYKTLLGKPVPNIKKCFYDQYGQDFPFDEVLKKTHETINNRFEKKGVPLKPGLIELLEYLKAHHYSTIVATSSDRQRVDHIFDLAHLHQYFDDSICGDEVTHGKPDPEIFLKACEKLHVAPSDAFVLEDSEAGLQAAHSGHIHVICVPDMKYPEEKYASMATAIVPSLKEVIEVLEK